MFLKKFDTCMGGLSGYYVFGLFERVLHQITDVHFGI